jgi:hypothetical protein
VTDPFVIAAQGESGFVVRLRGDGREAESWCRLGPWPREELRLAVDDEEPVRRTVRCLPGHRDVADSPDIVRGRRRRPPRRRPRLMAQGTLR